ncbi:caspase family protein [Rhizobium ruizarguesonis]
MVRPPSQYLLLALALTLFAQVGLAQTIPQTSLQHFELLANTDLTDGDFAEALGNPRLRGISADTCAAICMATEGCVGFTYNEKAAVCFPKKEIGKVMSFPGALSGVKPGLEVRAPASNDFSPYLLKDNCVAARDRGAKISGLVTVGFDAGALQIGKPSKVTFETPGVPDRFPAFLVLSFDQPVRFRGAGFYVLGPGAKGAFNSKFDQTKTRVVVPLFGRSRRSSGEFSFIPLTLKELAVSASLIVQTGCGETTKSISGWKFAKPSVRVPRIFMYDKFGGAPAASFNSPTEDRYVDVFATFFRLVSTVSEAPIAEITGKDPVFSPTGRFVAARFANGYRIFDTVDGAPLGVAGSSVAWDVSDSFIIGDLGIWGEVEVRSPFIEPEDSGVADPRAKRVGISCHACSGIRDTTVKIDLENNLLLSAEMNTGSGVPNVLSLTTQAANAKGQTGLDFAEDEAGIVPVKFPKAWETRSKLQFTSVYGISSGGSFEGSEEDILHLSQNFMTRPIVRPLTSQSATAQRAEGIAERLLHRLEGEYGEKFHSGRDFEEQDNHATPPGDPNRRYGLPVDDKVLLSNWHCGREEKSGDWIADFADTWKLHVNDQDLTLIGFGCLYGTSGTESVLGGIYSTEQPGQVRAVPFNVTYNDERDTGGGCYPDCGFRAKLIADRYVLLWSAGGGQIAVYDIVLRRLGAFPAFRGRLMTDVFLSDDFQRLLQVNSDGTFAIYDAFPDQDTASSTRTAVSIGGDDKVTSSLQLLGHYDDDELVIWTPDGYFDAGYEASHQIFLKFDGSDDSFSFEQFASKLLRRGLYQEVLERKFVPQPIAYDSPPVIVSKLERSSPSRINITMTQVAGQSLKSVMVFQDGVLTDQSSLPSKKGRLDISVERKQGTKWIAVVAVDQNGLTSSPASFQLTEAPPKRNLAVLVVGIDEYSDPHLASLNFSKTDAFSFSEAISEYAKGRYASISLNQLGDQEASKEALLAAITEIAAEGGGDTDIAIYFSGHGLQDTDGNLYLGLTDTRVDDLQNTGLPWETIVHTISTSGARVTVILDTCHSGGAGERMFATNDRLATPLVDPSKSLVTVLAASKGRERSLEDSSEGGGLFTNALSGILRDTSGAFDTNKNGLLEISEIYRGVKTAVSMKASGIQTPWLAANPLAGEYPSF